MSKRWIAILTVALVAIVLIWTHSHLIYHWLLALHGHR